MSKCIRCGRGWSVCLVLVASIGGIAPPAAGIIPAAEDQTLLLAFPGAEGFGACTPGGRGGKVCLVTTVEDYLEGKEEPIEGSLRAAVEAMGPRIVVFRVSGTIALKGPLFIRNPYITIAGQTAPGDGICVRNYRVVLQTHDIVIRHMRFRLGDLAREEQITVHVMNGNNFILDHCSIAWAIDENLSSFGQCNNVTVQWCIISEGLWRTYHPKGQHSNGSILGGDGGMTYHHNIYAHNASRSARVNTVVLDFRNSVIYDWGYRCAYTRSGPCYVNWINNYIKPGPSTRESAGTNIFHPGDDTARVFLSGNVLEGYPQETLDNRLMVQVRGVDDVESFLGKVVVGEPFPCPAVRTDSPEVALERVLADCGATLPKRDSADSRLMEEIRTGTGKIIDSQEEVGGWPVLNSAPPPADSDSDGMPDDWETQHKLNPEDAADNNADADGDGYTNIEEYLNATNPRVAEQGCRVNAAEFRKVQRQAVALAAQGNREEAQREAQRMAREQARKKEVIESLKVAIEPREGPGVKKIIVKLGGKAEMEMVLIPAGSFTMGSPESEGGVENEWPQHKVNISRAFYLATTPVTYAQFRAVLGDEGSDKNKDLPANVDWFQGMEFCEIVSAITGRKFRLPTEAEWEYACRAGTTTAFNTGDTITTDQGNFNSLEASRYNPVGVYRGGSVPAKTLPPNAWGLYGMHGNEAEYCLDRWLRTYTAKEVTDPMNRWGSGQRVLRGGRATSKAFFIRSAYRYRYSPDVEFSFRPVLELKK